jgi:hypothetical protein
MNKCGDSSKLFMTTEQRSILISGPNKDLFDNALKLYIFFRHIPLKDLNTDLQDRFRHDGNVVYSLIIDYVRNEKFSFEYFEFLNEELKKLSQLDKSFFKDFTILPTEIKEMELSDRVPLKFTDDDNNITYKILYDKKSGQCDVEIIS